MHIPADIIRGVAAELAGSKDRRTLSNLSVVNREAYDVCTPLLYGELEIAAKRSAGVLRLSPRDVTGFPGFDSDGQCGGWETGTLGDRSERRGVVRRLAALSHVKRVVVRSLPPDHVSASFGAAAATLAPSIPIFPRLQAVSILPEAVDGLRTWTPDNYDRPHNPPFLEALSSGSSPSHLCVAFRLVPSIEWELHRELTTSGQYALVRKIELLASTWTLESVTFHDIVHQVPPNVPCTTNIYHFAPHAIAHPLFARRYKFPTGQQAVGLPGPEWNIRPWQMSLAVKTLLPSGADHAITLQRTRWVFCGLANHVLTKAARDDDDSTGVWYREVEDMIRDSIRVGLDRDMPARDMSTEQIETMWSKIWYEKAKECQACHRRCGMTEASLTTGDPEEHQVMTLEGL